MRRRTLTRAVAAAAVVLGLGVLAAPSASAHDQLVSTDPADGATVATVPDHVTISFEDPAVALGTVVEVTGPDGSVVSSGDPQLVDSDVTEAITAEDLPAGEYTVEWRVTSPDGHPVSGKSTFTAKTGSDDDGPTPEPTVSPSTAAADDGSASDDSNEPAVGQPISSPTTAASASQSDDGNGSVVWLVVGIGVLIGIGLGLLGWWRARRRTVVDDSAAGPDGSGAGEV